MYQSILLNPANSNEKKATSGKFNSIKSKILRKKTSSSSGGSATVKSNKTKEFLSKLSGSFFIVIALMPLAGLCLGIGATILSETPAVHNAGTLIASSFGQILNQIGSALFANLGLFFCIAIVMGFTKNWQSTMSSLWGFFIFNALQAAILQSFAHNINMDDPSGTFVFLFYQNAPVSVLATNAGFLSMNSSVIGGLAVGVITIWCWNKYKDAELPSFLSFFSGARFVPFVVTVAVIPLALIYLIAWPIIGIGLVKLGQDLGSLHGFQFFLYALIWRWLNPIGIHHAFYTIFWFTPVGGSLSANDLIYVGNNPGYIHSEFAKTGPDDKYATIANYLAYLGKPSVGITYPQGDNGVWFFLEKNNIPFNSYIFSQDSYGNLTRIDANTGLWLAPHFAPFIGGSVGSGVAMVYTSPKKDRKKVAAVISSAIATSFAIGITEPWLWSYIIISPALYFVFHSGMVALSAYFMAILPTKGPVGGFGGANLPGPNGTTIHALSHSHAATTLSCGLLDYIIYGLLPIAKGTSPYWIAVLIVAYFFAYLGAFWFWIRFRKLRIPAIEDDGEVLQVTKDAARTQRDKGLVVNNLIIGLGGASNIDNLFNCATRVRVDVKNAGLVDTKIIHQSGAIKTLILGNNIQVIYGVTAQQIAQRANNFINENPTFGDDFNSNKSSTPKASSTLKQSPAKKTVNNPKTITKKATAKSSKKIQKIPTKKTKK